MLDCIQQHHGVEQYNDNFAWLVRSSRHIYGVEEIHGGLLPSVSLESQRIDAW